MGRRFTFPFLPPRERSRINTQVARQFRLRYSLTMPMMAQALPEVVRHRPGVISQEPDDAGQPRKCGGGITYLPVADGLGVGADPPGHVLLQQAKFQPSTPDMVP